MKVSGDKKFLYDKGMEVLIETARFWASRLEYVKDKDRYEITMVTGPDEWHEPVNNNLYTNYLARWNINYVLKELSKMKMESFDEYNILISKLGFSEAEVVEFKEKQAKIYLPKASDSSLLEQFEDYFNLKDIVIEKYDKNDWPIKPEILKQVKISDTQIIKQADVVMLLHLLTDEFDEKTLIENYKYYEKRTLHGSSLSPSIYSIMGLKINDTNKAYRYLRRAAFIDIDNIQGNTREGIHAANAGGVWQIVILGYAGVSIDENYMLYINPNLPKEWSELKFKIKYKDSVLCVQISGNNDVDISHDNANKIKINIKGELKEV